MHAHEMVSLAYHAVGAINERLAIAAYSNMAAIVGELGEVDLARALFLSMRRDESAHLGYYRTYARQLRPHIAPWQRSLVRTVIVRTYAPVGAGCRADKALFGRALTVLESDLHGSAIAAAVNDIAVELLATPGRTLPPFLIGAMKHCLDVANEHISDPQLRRRPISTPHDRLANVTTAASTTPGHFVSEQGSSRQS